MGFGVGFRSPFQAHQNGDDKRIAENAKTPQAQQAIVDQARHEDNLGRGSMGDAKGAGKSLREALGATLGGTSAVGNVAGAYEDSGVHAGKDPVSG